MYSKNEKCLCITNIHLGRPLERAQVQVRSYQVSYDEWNMSISWYVSWLKGTGTGVGS